MAKNIPSHIGFIMDGNGRWAKMRGLPRNVGHEAGAKACEKIIDYCRKLKLEAATFYTFSTENWSRPKEEVDGLMNLFERYIIDIKKKIISDEANAYDDVSLCFIGDLSVFSDKIRSGLYELENLTAKNNTKCKINFAVNYGGREEIVNAVNVFMAKNPGKSITAADISANLYTAKIPEPDLIIRTAGEMRLSNFMIWQSSYSEYYASKVFWPDFSPKELDTAIEEYSKRTRKFGNIER